MNLIYDFIPIVISERKISWQELFIPGFFTLLGSLIGAWLAGRYAVKTVKKQLEYDRLISKRNEIEIFLKEIPIFLSHVRADIIYSNQLIDEFEDTKKYVSKLHLKNLVDGVFNNTNKTLTVLDNMDLTKIPYFYYYDYIIIKENINGMFTDIEYIKDKLELKDFKNNDLYVLKEYKDFKVDLKTVDEIHKKMRLDYDNSLKDLEKIIDELNESGFVNVKCFIGNQICLKRF